MNKIKALLIAGLLSISSVSFAATYDFAAYADGSLAGSTSVTGLGEAGYAAFNATDDGLTVTASGSATNDDDPYQFAYLDEGNAGLGVCKDIGTLNGVANQCIPRYDDNVTGGETLKLDFGLQSVAIDILELVDANHKTAFNDPNDSTVLPGDFGIKVDGGAMQVLTLAAFPDITGILHGKVFEFINIGGGVNSEFYINNLSVSRVPVPAAGILFASALLGAGALGRRKKKAKASVVGAFARAS